MFNKMGFDSINVTVFNIIFSGGVIEELLFKITLVISLLTYYVYIYYQQIEINRLIILCKFLSYFFNL